MKVMRRRCTFLGTSRNQRPVHFAACLQLLGMCVFLTIFGVALSQSVQGESNLEQQSVDRAVEELEQLLREAITAAGGDPETQRLHLVIGFSTGHYGIDPLRAQAARLTAWGLANDFLVRGDQVSVYSFEMTIWDQPGANLNPMTVPADVGPEKEAIRSLFPMTPQAGSEGGHDTELAIVEMANHVDLSSGTVMVLFTNRAASLTTNPAVPIIGEDDPRYQAVLQNWRRLDQVNQTGASFEPVYDIVRANDELVTRSLDVIVLIPRVFQAPKLAEGTRSARLDIASEPEPDLELSLDAEREPSGSVSPGILLVPILLVLAVGLLLVRRRRGGGSGRVLSVNSHRFAIGEASNGGDIVRLVGPGFRQANPGDDRAIEVGTSTTPPQELARFVRSGNNVLVKDALFTLHEVDSSTVSAPYTLPADSEVQLVLLGEVVPEPGRPPREVTVKITVELGDS